MNSSNNTIRPFRPTELPAFRTGKPAVCTAGLKPIQGKCGHIVRAGSFGSIAGFA